MAGTDPAKRDRPAKEREAEEQLLVEAAQRDPAQFAGLYRYFFETVYSYVARRVRNRDEAEDLTAEVFQKALASLPRFKWRGAPFAAWLFRIASNMIADRAKRLARGAVDPQNAGDLSGDQPADSKKDTQANLEDVERQSQLFRLVEELADDQRRVVMMRFTEEKSIREIAQELGRTEGAVKQLQFRALENLRRAVTSDKL